MRRKKILAGTLALMFVIGGTALPSAFKKADTAVTASADTAEDFIYYLTDNGTTATLRGYSNSSSTTCTVPDKLGEKPVVTIGDYAFRDKIYLQEIHIPQTVDCFAKGAFKGCRSLNNINFPNTLKIIDMSAFEGCTSLESATIPKSVETIGRSAFSGCTDLHDVTISDGVKKIDTKAFENCTSLRTITIPNSVTEIGDLVFSGCDNLKGIKGCSGSVAEKYAKAYGLKFEPIDKPNDSSKPNSSSPDKPKFLMGDVNDDGNIDVEDAVMVIGHVNGAKALTDDEEKRADVDGNNNIDIEDAVAIIAHVNGVKVIE